MTFQGVGKVDFVEVGEAGDDGAEAVCVFEEGDGAVGVDGGVVPGGDDAVSFLLGGIPVGRDVGVGAVEDDEGFGGGIGGLPLVLARETCPRRVPKGPRVASSKTGRWVATRPAE